MQIIYRKLKRRFCFRLNITWSNFGTEIVKPIVIMGAGGRLNAITKAFGGIPIFNG